MFHSTRLSAAIPGGPHTAICDVANGAEADNTGGGPAGCAAALAAPTAAAPGPPPT